MQGSIVVGVFNKIKKISGAITARRGGESGPFGLNRLKDSKCTKYIIKRLKFLPLTVNEKQR